MVLLILAVIWAAVLIPPMLRARAESTAADSIGDFRRQLRVLQRTRRSVGSPHELVERATVPAGSPVADRPLALVGQPATVLHLVPQPPPGHRAAGGLSPSARARTIRRRRDVFFSLVMGMGTTFVMAMVLTETALWVLHLVIDGLFLGYLALLVRMRNIAAEREMKLRFLPPPAPRPQPAPVLLRRSAN